MKKKPGKQKLSKKFREDVWEKYNGKNYHGKCFCCGSEISIINFDCGHVISEKNGGETSIANMRPVCRPCNLSMSSTNMNDYMNKYSYKKANNWEGFDASACCIIM